MTPTEILAIVALTVYALYKQSIKHPVVGRTRFKLALIYIVVGVVVGGFYVPVDSLSWFLLAGSMLLSIVVGVARGSWSRLWREPDGQVFTQGTPLTIGLFLLLIGAKFALGTWQYMNHQPNQHGGFGEVLILIGLMVAMQAEIVWRRAQALLTPDASQSAAFVSIPSHSTQEKFK